MVSPRAARRAELADHVEHAQWPGNAQSGGRFVDYLPVVHDQPVFDKRVFLLCFGDEEPGTQRPRRVSQAEIREAFSDGWDVEEIRESRYEVRPDLDGRSFSEGGPKAWFSVIRRAS